MVEVNCDPGVTAGLLFGNQEGLVTDGKTVRYNSNEDWRTRNSELTVETGHKILLKIRNHRQDLSFFCSLDGGVNWVHFQNGVRAGDYTARLVAAGKGKAVFRNFRYYGLENF